MADSNQLKQAQAVYKTMREMFDTRELSYEADEGKLTIYSGAQGDDLPVGIRMSVDPERMLIVAHSLLPFETPQDRRVEMAVAVSRANYNLHDGSFDYDITSGAIVFRLATCYRDSIIGADLIEYMFVVAFGIIDEYNDVLEKVAKSDMSIVDVIKTIK